MVLILLGKLTNDILGNYQLSSDFCPSSLIREPSVWAGVPNPTAAKAGKKIASLLLSGQMNGLSGSNSQVLAEPALLIREIASIFCGVL